MGGGMAAVAAGSHADEVATAFLMDPVDWNLESNRVDSQYLSGYNSPIFGMVFGTMLLVQPTAANCTNHHMLHSCLD